MTLPSPRRAVGGTLLAAALLVGCASVPEGPRAPSDPWEPMNRQVFAFNEKVDQVFLKPAANAYRDVVPALVRTGVSNFFGNLADAWSSINLLLQARMQDGLEMGMRVIANTFFGLGGILDPATGMRLERNTVEDFGQTLGRWGMPPGPYLVLPFFGPSDLRDGSALALDVSALQPGRVFHKVPERNTAAVLWTLDQRVKLFAAERVLNVMAFDKYTLFRDAYLARRRSLVYDDRHPDDDADPAPPR